MSNFPHSRPIGINQQAHLFGSDEFTLKEAGDIQTDRYGLSTGTCVYEGPKDKAVAFHDSLSASFAHPYADYLTIERKRVVLSPGMATVQCEFAGCLAASDYIYEFEAGAKEEPIQTHPAFPTLERKYGIVMDPTTGYISYGNFYYANGWGWIAAREHVRFQSQSPVAGVESYLSFSNGIWKATHTTPTRPTEALAAIGTISTPPGNPPTIQDARTIQYISIPSQWHAGATPDDPGFLTYNFNKAKLARKTGEVRNWLYMGFSYTERGAAFVVTHQWLLSGIGGWNPLIYNTTDIDFDAEFGD